MTNANLLLRLLQKHQPISRETLFQMSDFSRSEFRAAWREVKNHVWTIQGKPPVLEIKTETTVL